MTRYEQGFLTKCAEYGIDGKSFLKYAARPQRLILGEAWKSMSREARKKLGKQLVEGLKRRGWLKTKGFGLIPSRQKSTKIKFGDKLYPGHDRATSLIDDYIHGYANVSWPTKEFPGWDSLIPAREITESTMFPISLGLH